MMTKPPKDNPRKSSLRVMMEIVVALCLFEMYAYHQLALTTQTLDMNGLDDPEGERTKLVAPNVHRKQRKKDQHHKIGRHKKRSQEMKLQRQEIKKAHQELNVEDDADSDPDKLKTAEKLRHMGVSGDIKLSELPSWSQIVDNFNSYSQDDEPVILGLEYCEDFRKSKDPKLIGVGPAGLFSTGTNLINTLVRSNCMGPHHRGSMGDKFALVQVPYGKHNPADARFHHQVTVPVVDDRESILPIVAIRHPYTWMSAMCTHSYRTKWRHKKEECHKTLHLDHPVFEVPWGFKKYNETHNVTNSYQSLAHMWKDWYKPYFLDSQYNQMPRLMVRHEDMVYRPEKVVSKICDCVGGTNRNKNPDWEHKDGFEYEEESANHGRGHGGGGRSGLLTAVIKYGQPIQHWYDQYTASDRNVMKEAFQGESDPELRKIFETFQYKLSDETREPTKKEKMRVAERLYAAEKHKDAEKETVAKLQVKRKAALGGKTLTHATHA